MKKLTQVGLLSRVKELELSATDVVNYGQGLITLNQASQWLNSGKHGRTMSNPVLLMLDMMCDKYEGGVTHQIKSIKESNPIETVEVILNKDVSVAPKTKVIMIDDPSIKKKVLPEPAFMRKDGVVYFRYGECAYMFDYTGEKEVVFVQDEWDVTASGDFEKLVGNMSFY